MGGIGIMPRVSRKKVEQNEGKENRLHSFGKSNSLGLSGKLQCWKSIL